MKLTEERQQVERHGVTKKIKCAMAVNAHSFRLLARQYSDPIKAICQEIGANCADAHARVGKQDVPWKLTLPGPLDPHVRWRDYGVSMSPEVIENVYANYMTSDKRDTDDEAGYFGIGSKTPLAYTDSFNITTYLNGKLRMYTVCYDEEGVPEINQFGEYDTDEPDGVEVSFSVKEDDWEKFYAAARHVYSFYDVHPLINGVDDFAAKTYERVIEGDDWFFSGRSNDSYVIMGNIGYKVDSYRFSGLAYDILKNGLHFHMPMGSVYMTPSRETLEYNEHTINNIQKRVEEIHAAASEQVSEEIGQARSAWHAADMLKEWNRKFYSFNFDTSSCQFDVQDSVELTAGQIYKYYKDNTKIKRQQSGFSHYSPIGGHYRYVIKDIDRGFDKRSRFYVEQEGVTIHLLDPSTQKSVLMDELGVVADDNVVFLASELPEPPKNSTAGGPRGPRKKTKTVKLFCPSGNSKNWNNIYASRYWQDEEVDPTQGEVIFVMLDRYDVRDYSGRGIDMRSLGRLMDSVDLDMPEVIGLNSKNAKLAERKNFKPFLEWMREQVENLIDDNVVANGVKYSTYHKLENKQVLSSIADESTVKFEDENNVLCQIVEYIRGFASDGSEQFIKNLLDISEKVGYNFEGGKCDESIIALETKFKTDYPLLWDYIDNQGWRVNQQRADWIVSAINCFDKCEV